MDVILMRKKIADFALKRWLPYSVSLDAHALFKMNIT